MGNNIAVDFQALDFDGAVDEVDILVPRYLDSLRALLEAEKFEDIPQHVADVETYWERLTTLMSGLSNLEQEIPFEDIQTNSLQSELATLEKVYLRINLRIEFSSNQWTKALWRAADAVLHRMDAVLEGLEFADDHDDRLLVGEMRANNQLKEQQWLRRNKIAG